MGTFIYIITETFRGLFKAKMMTFISIATIAVTLFFLGVIVTVGMNVRRWLDDTAKKANVVVYLDDSLSADSPRLAGLLEDITHFDGVDSLHLVTRDAAWREFEAHYGPRMLEAVSENPFPARLDIILEQKRIGAAAVDSLQHKLARYAGIEGIQYSGELLSRLAKFNKLFRWSAAVMVVILLLALHFMIANTVKLTIYARKDLIVNMQFVGATDRFIKAPFILEGVLQGMIGGAFGVVLIAVLRLFLFRFAIYWGAWYFFPTLFTVGVLFGWFGSTRAVRRFLQ